MKTLISDPTKIHTDPDYINAPKYANSLKRLLAKFPNGVEPQIIAEVMMINLSDVQAEYQKVVLKLRRMMK